MIKLSELIPEREGNFAQILFQVGPETDFAYVTGAISRFSLQLNS